MRLETYMALQGVRIRKCQERAEKLEAALADLVDYVEWGRLPAEAPDRPTSFAEWQRMGTEALEAAHEALDAD